MAFDYNDIFHITQYKDPNNGSIVKVTRTNIPLEVFEGKIYLGEKPIQFDHVRITDMYEISLSSIISDNTQFKVDYDSGIVYVDASKNGQTVYVSYTTSSKIRYKASFVELEDTNNNFVNKDIEGALSETLLRVKNLVESSPQSTEAQDARSDGVRGTNFTTLKNRLDQDSQDILNLQNSLGDTTALNTTDKTNVINAINEVSNKTNTNTSKIGTLANLITQNKTDLVSAINENTTNITEGGLDRVKSSSKFVTTMTSWIGLLNTKYTSDNATRFYILPKDHVTTGVGGCLKIFADAYQDGQDYRDIGIYFSADQNGDKGYYGNGVNWINVKVLDGGVYAGKHPDLGFSFQDGTVVAGRITCFNNTRPVWVFGSGKPSILNTALIAEYQGHVGFTKGNSLKFMTADDSKGHSLSDDTDDTLKWSILNGEKKYINGTQVENKTLNTSEFKNALITSSRKNVTTDGTSIDVTGVNRIVINQPSTGNNIDTITGGIDGQEIILVNVAGNTSPQHTSIVNGTSIKLQNGTNFSMGYNNSLTLVYIGSTWYEKCRSING